MRETKHGLPTPGVRVQNRNDLRICQVSHMRGCHLQARMAVGSAPYIWDPLAVAELLEAQSERRDSGDLRPGSRSLLEQVRLTTWMFWQGLDLNDYVLAGARIERSEQLSYAQVALIRLKRSCLPHA